MGPTCSGNPMDKLYAYLHPNPQQTTDGTYGGTVALWVNNHARKRYFDEYNFNPAHTLPTDGQDE